MLSFRRIAPVALVATVLMGALLVSPTSEAQARVIGGRCKCVQCCPPPPQTVLLEACHPCCCGKKLAIPVCIPACIQGAPSVCYKRTVFGCGKVIYDWGCGYRVVVRLTKHGGYRIAYQG